MGSGLILVSLAFPHYKRKKTSSIPFSARPPCTHLFGCRCHLLLIHQDSPLKPLLIHTLDESLHRLLRYVFFIIVAHDQFVLVIVDFHDEKRQLPTVNCSLRCVSGGKIFEGEVDVFLADIVSLCKRMRQMGGAEGRSIRVGQSF